MHSVFVTDDGFVHAGAIASMVRDFDVRTVYVPVTMAVDQIVKLRNVGIDVVIMQHQLVDVGGLRVRALYQDGHLGHLVHLGYELWSAHTAILITARNISLSRFGHQELEHYDILRARTNINFEYSIQLVDTSFGDGAANVISIADTQGLYYDFEHNQVRAIRA
jgi:hypothetical protein